MTPFVNWTTLIVQVNIYLEMAYKKANIKQGDITNLKKSTQPEKMYCSPNNSNVFRISGILFFTQGQQLPA